MEKYTLKNSDEYIDAVMNEINEYLDKNDLEAVGNATITMLGKEITFGLGAGEFEILCNALDEIYDLAVDDGIIEETEQITLETLLSADVGDIILGSKVLEVHKEEGKCMLVFGIINE